MMQVEVLVFNFLQHNSLIQLLATRNVFNLLSNTLDTHSQKKCKYLRVCITFASSYRFHGRICKKAFDVLCLNWVSVFE